MEVAVIGGHGQIGLRLLQLLAERGDVARGVIRNPDHADDLTAVGAEPVMSDIENDSSAALATAIDGADAVVFAAGAGPGSGPERKQTVDLGGAVKLIDASREAGISRYVMISAMGAGKDLASLPEAMQAYYAAKIAADDAVRAAKLDYTILRPGRLTSDPQTGRIEAAATLTRAGEITREDVAAAALVCLDEPGTIGKTFDLLGGETPIAEAIRAL